MGHCTFANAAAILRSNVQVPNSIKIIRGPESARKVSHLRPKTFDIPTIAVQLRRDSSVLIIVLFSRAYRINIKISNKTTMPRTKPIISSSIPIRPHFLLEFQGSKSDSDAAIVCYALLRLATTLQNIQWSKGKIQRPQAST